MIPTNNTSTFAMAIHIEGFAGLTKSQTSIRAQVADGGIVWATQDGRALSHDSHHDDDARGLRFFRSDRVREAFQVHRADMEAAIVGAWAAHFQGQR